MSYVQSVDVSPLHPMQIEGYKCVSHSVFGFLYLPRSLLNHLKDISLNIQKVQNAALYPKKTFNEVALTPVVSITPDRHETLFNPDMQIVVELMKTIKIYEYGDRKIIPMCRNESQSHWEILCGEYEMFEDRIRLRTKYYEYFTTIIRFSPPTVSAIVDPNVSDTESQVEITIPELPGFKVQIPLKSVKHSTEVKATLYYDETEMCKDSNEVIATACIELEPHGIQFTEDISIQVPIPSYSKIITAHPDARLELLYSSSGYPKEWIVFKDVKVDMFPGGEYCAKFNTSSFSIWKFVWKDVEVSEDILKTIRTIFKYVKSLSSRCQVFMSQETDKTSEINFSVLVWVYPFSEYSHEIPTNYHYTIHDSGKIPIELTPGQLHFSMTLKDCLFNSSVAEEQKVYTKSHTISEKFPARAEFDIDLKQESKTEFRDGAVFAYLLIKEHDDDVRHDCNLFKVS